MGGIRGNESSVKRHHVCWSQTESGNRGAGIQQTISHRGRARHFVPPIPTSSFLEIPPTIPGAVYWLCGTRALPLSILYSVSKLGPTAGLPYGESLNHCPGILAESFSQPVRLSVGVLCVIYHPRLRSFSFPILLVSLAWPYISEIYVHPLSLVVLLYYSQVSLFLIL